MKTVIKLNYIILLFTVLSVYTGCTEDFTEMNTNPNAATTIEPKYLLTNSFRRGAMDYATYYYTQGYASFLCQYFANSNPGHITDAYYYSDPWNATFWSRNYAEQYAGFLGLADEAMDLANEKGMNNQEGPAKIWRTFLFHRMTDIWGAIPYFEAFDDNNLTPAYTPQDEIYNDMFEQLATAVDLIDETDDAYRMGTSDLIFYDDLLKWKRFANSLRLRLAMRLSNVSEQKARTEFETALQASGGVMADNRDNAGFVCDAAGPAALRDWNPLKVVAEYFPNWFKVSETTIDMLKDLDDPRIFWYVSPTRDYLDEMKSEYGKIDTTGLPEGTKYFIDAVKTDITNGQKIFEYGYGYLDNMEDTLVKYSSLTGKEDIFARYVGLRNGTPPSQLSVMQNELGGYSQVSEFIKQHEYPTYMLTYPEVCFLKAEAALKGWNVNGTAEAFYNEGVRAALEMYEVPDDLIDAYLLNVALKTGESTEVQLEQIITQKYLANFTNGFEGWAEWRRTGYPVLLQGQSEGDTGGKIPRRWMYTYDEKRFNEASLNAAIEAMGGTNDMMTPNWWDSEYSANPSHWQTVDGYDYFELTVDDK